MSSARPTRDHPHGFGSRAHGHSHGLVDASIVRSRQGVRAVSLSLAVLLVAALVQTAIFVASGSVALLADLIHNVGDALTAVPLGIAFFLRSYRGEKLAGFAVVAAILVSALVALYEAIDRLIHPQHLSHLWILAAAGGNRFRRQRGPGADPVARGPAPCEPLADRRRQPRPCRRLRLARRRGQRRRRRARPATCRPDRRPRDHPRDPRDHLGLVADNPRERTGRCSRPPPLAPMYGTASTPGSAFRGIRRLPRAWPMSGPSGQSTTEAKRWTGRPVAALRETGATGLAPTLYPHPYPVGRRGPFVRAALSFSGMRASSRSRSRPAPGRRRRCSWRRSSRPWLRRLRLRTTRRRRRRLPRRSSGPSLCP